MTREQLKAKFPNASEAFIDKNAPSFGYPRFHPPEETPVVKPAPKRIRQSSKPLLNKLETEFYDSVKIWFTASYQQAIRFRLGNGIWYKPDFVLFGAPGSKPKVIEVKGPHAFRGGFENLKVAAGLYPAFQFCLVWKQDGKWQEQVVLP